MPLPGKSCANRADRPRPAEPRRRLAGIVWRLAAFLGLAFLGGAGRAAGAALSPNELPPSLIGLREVIDAAMHWISTGIEVTGVLIIVIGAAASTLLFVHAGLITAGWPAAFRLYRANLGRGILLGLELLVAADIIGTIAVTPSFRSLGVLGLIVLIRTFLSFSLEVEIEGRWPWQRHDKDRDSTERL
jgi:uncharacterized membrane protein